MLHTSELSLLLNLALYTLQAAFRSVIGVMRMQAVARNPATVSRWRGTGWDPMLMVVRWCHVEAPRTAAVIRRRAASSAPCARLLWPRSLFLLLPSPWTSQWLLLTLLPAANRSRWLWAMPVSTQCDRFTCSAFYLIGSVLLILNGCCNGYTDTDDTLQCMGDLWCRSSQPIVNVFTLTCKCMQLHVTAPLASRKLYSKRAAPISCTRNVCFQSISWHCFLSPVENSFWLFTWLC